MNPGGYTGFLIVTFPWLVVFLLLRAFISSQFILTSAPGRTQLVSLEELFLFDDAGKGDRK